VRPDAHRWVARTVGSACSTGCHEPLARSSRPPGGACLRRAPYMRCGASVCNCLGASLFLAPSAPTMRLAVRCAWSSGLGAALLLGIVRHRHAPCSEGCHRLAAALVQPSCWHRLPPPCALQCRVPSAIASLIQPSSSHYARLPIAPASTLAWALCAAAAGVGFGGRCALSHRCRMFPGTLISLYIAPSMTW
jgi:hypothetical protein